MWLSAAQCTECGGVRRSVAECGECGMQVDIITNGSYHLANYQRRYHKKILNDQNRFYRNSGIHFLKRYISKWIYGGDVSCEKPSSKITSYTLKYWFMNSSVRLGFGLTFCLRVMD